MGKEELRSMIFRILSAMKEYYGGLIMKLLIILLTAIAVAHAQVPVSSKLPTEDLQVPGTTLPQDSSIEQVVENADKVEAIETPLPTDIREQVLRRRSLGTVLVGYQVLSSWIPLKKTLSYSHIFSPKFTLEGEYGWGSFGVPAWIIDVAQIRERRYSLLARHYTRNSFHFIYGASYNRMEATVGSKYLKNAGAGSQDVINVQGIGISLGLGNRWQWNNGITVGLDWFRTHIPLINRRADSAILDNIQQSEQSKIKDTISWLKNVPTVVLLGLNVGYTF